ncbi:MAG: aminopeptidase P family protein [Clostridium argentinense]|uniref:Aminopeptidase P family protein n=1 Tax=Clostridium faecium TaxID=2762223 RepID=A0ABR8YW85_9CLOT|nr:aminopeptidase P family protein [Clostridium faecium]MBD8048439.1 aminopeptidase P family protein [Clostridium faecium]MBS5824843.1 aminopeptidase P family protein [Clostridium argentinense]MDU1348849.1 aminopeptidase P family protein [Clostridium argentinense]
MTIKERIEKLRGLMREKNIQTYIIPSFDAHQSEYVAEYYKSRAWISGFTGSAGTVVVTLNSAGLWTDGRYFIQAEKQLQGSGIELFKMGQPSVPTYIEWIKENVEKSSTIGFDGKVFPVSLYKGMLLKLASKNLKFETKYDLIDEIWQGRPELPSSQVFIHDIKYAGKTRSEKLNDVRNEMKKIGSDYFILSSLDDIAWLFNIRGRDIDKNPVVISYAVIEENKAHLFVNLSKVSKEIVKELSRDNIEVKPYEEIKNFIKSISENKVVTYDPAKTNVMILDSMKSSITKIEEANITTKLKAVKNKIEIENTRKAEIRDCVAMVKFIKWLKESVGRGKKITEISADNKLTSLRAENELFIEPSFNTIAAYKEHAAMMHYSATPETDYELKPEGLFLIDSGGQYYDGTTDITRTIVLGPLTEEEKRDFTLVARGNIGLSKAKFLVGTAGCNLDILARKPLWDAGLDYKCGTGHGVGYLLNVHEGPHGISRVTNSTKLEVGMNVTNEPGVYKEGKHGIRLENMLFVTEDEITEYGGEFLKFETITFCPFDLDGIIPEMMTEDEREWLNNYHKETYEKLSPYLNDEEKAFLKYETRSI